MQTGRKVGIAATQLPDTWTKGISGEAGPRKGADRSAAGMVVPTGNRSTAAGQAKARSAAIDGTKVWHAGTGSVGVGSNASPHFRLSPVRFRNFLLTVIAVT
jgi:hypothetical protein